MSTKRDGDERRPLVVIDKLFPAFMMEWLEARAEVVVLSDEPSQQVREKVEAILWYGHGEVTAKIMDTFPNAKVVSNFGTGYEFVDCDAAIARGMPVGHTPGCLSETVADFAFALMLAAARDLVGGVTRAAHPGFDAINPNELGKQVSGATIGIVGMGGIGAAIARRAGAFQMKVLYHNRRKKGDAYEKEAGNATFCSTLEPLLAESDYVMLACPATPETKDLMGTQQFALMKNDAIFCNIARGVCVNQEALVHALEVGEIAFAALDVTDPEPLPRDHPLVQTSGTKLEGKVLITPHQGSATAETRLMMLKMAFDNVLAGLDKLRLPWTVPEAEKMFADGATVGANKWSGQTPKP